MNSFFRMISSRWSREEIASWGSVRKTAYLLLPLLFYFVAHDVAEILLWAGLNRVMTAGSEGLVNFLTDNAYTVNGAINGLAILAGVAAIWGAVYGEIRGNEKERKHSTEEKERTSGDGKCAKTDSSPVPVEGVISSQVTRYMVTGALAFLSALAFNLLFSLWGLTSGSEGYARTASAQYGVNFVAGLFLYGIVSPAAEEAVFRGLIYNRMKRCFGYLIALPVSSLFFGCYHGNWVQALYGTLLGLLIAWTYEKCGSFAAPVLFHAVANVSIYALTYHGSLENMGRAVSVAVMAVCLAGMAGCLFYIGRKVRE